MLLVLASALVVRGVAVLAVGFPINDGGLFVAMADELVRQGWYLPATVPWNGMDLPFAYPPLGIYAASATAAIVGTDVETVMRFLPWMVSSLTAVLVAALGLSLLRSRGGALVAGLVYAFAPSAFTWTIAGGGITRAPGLALSVATIWLLLRLVERPTYPRAWALGVVAAATVLTHPASTVFAVATSIGLIAHAGTRPSRIGREFGRASLWAAVVAVAIALPWLALVVAEHGVGVFGEVASNGPEPDAAMLGLLAGRITGLGTDPLGLAILLAAIASIARGRWLLPAWLCGAALLGTQYAIIPGALLMGQVVAEVLVESARANMRLWVVRRAAAGVVAVLVALQALVGLGARSEVGSHLHSLDEDRREAMGWVRENTRPTAVFAVLTGDHWSVDPDSEWFFAIAGRTSAATVQGHEWRGRDAYARVSEQYASLQACSESISCLEEWMDRVGADHVFIPKGQRHGPDSAHDCCAGVRDNLGATEHEVVYDGLGATIVRVTTPED